MIFRKKSPPKPKPMAPVPAKTQDPRTRLKNFRRAHNRVQEQMNNPRLPQSELGHLLEKLTSIDAEIEELQEQLLSWT